MNAHLYQTKFPEVTWDNEKWSLTTTAIGQGHYESRMSLANGYFGINLAALGPFFEVDSPVNGDDIEGWPLFDRRQSFATIAGFYDVQPTTNMTNFGWLNQLGGESVISGIPHWAGLHLQYNGHVLDANTNKSQISKFKTSMNFKSGVLSWSYTWTPPAGSALNLVYTMFVHKLYVNQAAVQLNVTSSESVSGLTVLDVLNGDAAVRTHFVDSGLDSKLNAIWTEVQPSNIPYVSAWIYSTMSSSSIVKGSEKLATKHSFSGMNVSSVAMSAKLSALSKGKTISIEKFVGVASTDAFKDPKTVAQKACSTAASSGFGSMLQSHETEWHSILTADSVDNYSLPNGTLPDDRNIVSQQILAVTNPYGILQNTIGENAFEKGGSNENLTVNSVPVCGLGSSCYAGLIFWDVEVWMSPGIVVSHPQEMKQVANYRVDKYDEGEKENVHEATFST